MHDAEWALINHDWVVYWLSPDDPTLYSYLGYQPHRVEIHIMSSKFHNTTPKVIPQQFFLLAFFVCFLFVLTDARFTWQTTDRLIERLHLVHYLEVMEAKVKSLFEWNNKNKLVKICFPSFTNSRKELLPLTQQQDRSPLLCERTEKIHNKILFSCHTKVKMAPHKYQCLENAIHT